jgi:hypothetical protein
MLIAGGGIPYRFILNYKQIDARTPLLQYGSPWIEAMSQVSSGALASCGRRGAATCLSKKSATFHAGEIFRRSALAANPFK